MKKTSFPGSEDRKLRQRGSAIFIILFAVFLLGALYYAFAKGTRANLGLIEAERNNAAQIASTDCQTAIATATKRLQLRGCGTLISSAPDGSNTNIGAPKDGSCSIYHINGGGVKNCQGLIVSSDACNNSPAVGQVCADGSVYAGLSPDGNVPMYTTPADASSAMGWGPTGTDAMPDCHDPTPGGSSTCRTGAANTALLAGLSGSYPAAEYCDALAAHGKSDWYLPAQDELDVLYNDKNSGALGGSFDESSYPAFFYWSSSEFDDTDARDQRFTDGYQNSYNGKTYTISVRCVRKD